MSMWIFKTNLKNLCAAIMLASLFSCNWETYNPAEEEENHTGGQTEKPSNSNTTYFLEVTTPSVIPFSGGTTTFSVTSYKKNSEGKIMAVPFKLSYVSYDNSISDKAPSWLNISTSEPQNEKGVCKITARASGRSLESSSVSNYDLSTVGGSKARNTANCYLVHTPGSYMFPLVYGNAIKDGRDNAVAYKPDGNSNSSFLTPFINHEGKGISFPWIKDNGITVSGARIVWQDGKDLLTNIHLDGDFICFTVPDGAQEGNAVVAALSDNTIVWSWHIWLTNETADNLTEVGKDDSSFKVFPLNLGYAIDGMTLQNSIPLLSASLKMEQTEENSLSRVVTVKQAGNSNNEKKQSGYAFSTYYQWGRKDPLLPAAKNGRETRYAYDENGLKATQHGGNAIDIAQTIRRPDAHFANVSNQGPYGPFGSGQTMNLWNANATSSTSANKTVKTVYDPCPPGFCVPSPGFFHAVTKYGNYTTPDKGLLWQSSAGSFTLPRMGWCEHRDAGHWYVGTQGSYWTSSAEKESYAPFIQIGVDALLYGSSPRATGYSIRPVKE